MNHSAVMGQGRAWLTLGVVAFLLSACQDTASDEITPPDDPTWEGSFFSEGFVEAWDAFEAAARNLRENDSRYLEQENTWQFSPGEPFHDSYPLAASRIEYAHAAGLDGSARGDGGDEIIISVVDDGFYVDHPEFDGKNIYLPNGDADITLVSGERVFAPAGDGTTHGTSVAAVLAGNAAGVTLGVAPGASLAFGDYDSYESRSLATRHAISLGAIAQNNSWGLIDPDTKESLTVARHGIGDAFVGTKGNDYYQALQDFADIGVLVWALDNDVDATSADILAGLPAKNPALEDSWIAVANGVATFTSDRITDVELVSSACFEAAEWCLTADGTWYAADGASGYDLVTGTSFATPAVSGALALLAQAFPEHTPQQLRKRLLASADNSYFTSVDGTLDFGNGVLHSYNETFGHGFMDLRAALLPIGGSVIAMSNGDVVQQDTPLLHTGTAFGGAATKALHGVTVLATDALDADFALSVDALVAQRRPVSTGAARITRLSDDAAPSGTFAAALGGQEFSFAADAARISASLRRDTPDFALSFAPAAGGPLTFGATVGHDSGGILGFSISGQTGSALAALDLGWQHNASSGARFSLSGQLGLAAPDDRSFGGGSVGAVPVSAFEVAAVLPSGNGDQLSVSVGLPFGASGGTARLPVPVARQASGSGYSYDTIEIDLAPEARQIDLTLAYELDLGNNAALTLGGYHSLNFGHEKDQTDTGLVLSWQKRF